MSVTRLRRAKSGPSTQAGAQDAAPRHGDPEESRLIDRARHQALWLMVGSAVLVVLLIAVIARLMLF